MNDLLLDRTPPHNIEAEQAVLGAIFLEPESLVTAAETLTPEDFYRSAHQKIFSAMLKLNDAGHAVDVVTVTEQLQATNQLENVGGVSYLLELAKAVPTAANIDYYANIVEEKALLTRLIRTATNIAQEGFTREDEVEGLLSDAEKRILEVSNRKNAGSFQNIKDVLVRAYENIEMLHYRKGEITGIPTGFIELDRMTAGFQKNDLIIVAARPSVGKTAFALNIAQNVATKTDENVAIFHWRWVQNSLSCGCSVQKEILMRKTCEQGL